MARLLLHCRYYDDRAVCDDVARWISRRIEERTKSADLLGADLLPKGEVPMNVDAAAD